MNHPLTIESIKLAAKGLEQVLSPTPLQHNLNLSEAFDAEILLKREDLQTVRSYKIRGAFNKMSRLSAEEKATGVVCASAGNHAQGFAYSCFKLQVFGKVFMPATTPRQKVGQVKMFGKDYVEVTLVGDTFDDAFEEAKKYEDATGSIFIHPFDDWQIIEGQATTALEVLEQSKLPIDYLVLPVGGGGLSAGMSFVFKELSPHTKIIGVEPSGAPAMHKSLEAGKIIKLEKIDKFVDGAAVKVVGQRNFQICSTRLEQVVLVPEGKVCSSILQLYNQDAIVVEPAGVLSVAALDQLREEIKGKRAVCVISGSNNDISRTEEIRERSMLYEGLKHYFIVQFPQRAGALLEFLTEVLGPRDDIAYFQYSKKNSREKGPAVVGLELKRKADLDPLLNRMQNLGFQYEYLNDKPEIFHYIV